MLEKLCQNFETVRKLCKCERKKKSVGLLRDYITQLCLPHPHLILFKHFIYLFICISVCWGIFCSFC